MDIPATNLAFDHDRVVIVTVSTPSSKHTRFELMSFCSTAHGSIHSQLGSYLAQRPLYSRAVTRALPCPHNAPTPALL